MAEVYTGTHQSFGQVAVKVMRGLLERDSDQLARFQREAEVIEGLRHPNIVQMFDYTMVEDTPCIIMEYIPGPSLAAYLKTLHDNKQRLPIGIVAHILQSMASAMDYAHERGMVHRDIKPANVLLRSPSESVELGKPLPTDVEPILTDFGLVRLLDSTMHTTAGSVSGTPTYMSPEQARGEKVDKRTDIYSLGIMLYEMLAGAVPFQADTTFGMLMKHINEPPPPIKGISEDLRALLDRALAKDPSLRYDSAGDLAKEFMNLFNGQTISPGTLHIADLARKAAEASQQSKTRPAPERPARRWARIALEIALVAGLGGFIIFQFFIPPDSSVTAPPVPTPNPNTPVGRLRFDDFSFYMDNVILSLTNVSEPEKGTHYEAWLIGNDDKTVRDIGKISFNAGTAVRLENNDSAAANFLQDFDQVQITLEKDGVTITKPTGEVAYSSILPPQALVHIRHVVVAYNGVPDNQPLMQNLWYYGASYVDRSINGDQQDEEYKIGIVQAYKNNAEATLRKRTEEVINLLVGNLSDQYRDYDNNGEIADPGDGYGSLPSGDRQGYLQLTADHAKLAADAPDATSNIVSANDDLQVCIQNMDGWTNRLLELALQLNSTTFGPDMDPIIAEMSSLGTGLLNGKDGNGNGIFEIIPGECGADGAYKSAYALADMLILPGKDRIPPTPTK